MSAVRGLVLVHGGAGTYAPDLCAAAVEGTRRAAAAGRDKLRELGEREDACVEAALAAIRVLELDPTFNAGRGSCMTADGRFEVDAGIMRSRDGASGAIAAVVDLDGAAAVARAVMERSKHALLAGEGAARFAREHGVGEVDRGRLETAKALARYEAVRSGEMSADNRADTVGAIALDARGHLCAVGSTGGVLLKLPGRVGDTPLIGAGFYADAALGAALGTGVGEAIMRRVGCYELLRRAAEGSGLQLAAEQLCEHIRGESGAAVGFIAVGPQGQVAIANASDHMSWALAELDNEDLAGGLSANRSVV